MKSPIRKILPRHFNGFDRLRRYPQTYRLLALISAHYRENIALVGMALAVEGYPRCGNSFLTELLRLRLPRETGISQHIHQIGNLKLACRNKIPTTILFRDPLEAVPSAALRMVSSDLTRLASEYLVFYRWVLDHMVDRCLLIEANDLFANPDKAVERVFDHSNLLHHYKPITEEDIAAARQTLDAFNLEKHGGDPLRVSYPNENKDRAKASLRDEFRETDDFEQCVSLYEHLSALKAQL